MIPLEKVKDILNKHAKLEVDLSSAEIDKKKFAEMSKEYSDLNEIIDQAKNYLNFEKNKRDLEKLINDSDKEIKEMAQLELEQLIKNNDLNEKNEYPKNMSVKPTKIVKDTVLVKNFIFF